MRGAAVDAILPDIPAAAEHRTLAARRAPAAGARIVRLALILAVLSAAAVGTRFAADALHQHYIATTAPSVASIDVAALFLDNTPVPLTITAAWEKIPYVATADAVRSDVTLWRRMHVEDWDTVPVPLQREALEAMLARYRPVLASPAVWDRMTAHDWDLVPQPMRALAFRHMVEYWSGYYQVGAAYAIPRGTMTDSLVALVMTESWFDHRAVNENPWGNRDLGVAQAADGTRDRMRRLHDAGSVDVRLEDDDYFDPWKGTRFVALWMGLLLDEVQGDLDTALRAYHRGTSRALRGEGAEYLEITKRRLHRFVRNEERRGAWDYLWHRDRALVTGSWPWLTRTTPGESMERPGEPVSAPDDVSCRDRSDVDQRSRAGAPSPR